MEKNNEWSEKRHQLFISFFQSLENGEGRDVLRKQFEEIIDASLILEDRKQFSGENRFKLMEYLYKNMDRAFGIKKVFPYILGVILGILVSFLGIFIYTSF